MKGFGVYSKGNVGWIEKPDYVCGPDDAILRPIALSPCTSDVHSAYEMEGPWLINRILGHEACGEILKVGENVTDFKAGDRVIIPCTTPTWKHPDLQDGPVQHAGGLFTAINFSNYEDGTFCDQIKVRSADMNLCCIPEGVTLEQAVMITDMVTTGFHSVELGGVKLGDTVAVFGIGPVGLMAVAGSVLSGAGRLIGVGTRPNCVALAKEYGATDIINYKEGDIIEQIMDLTDGKGVDVAILAGGDQETFQAAWAVTKNGGTVSVITVYTGIDHFEIPYEYSGGGLLGHKKLIGGLCPGGRKRTERLLSLVQAGRFDPGKLVTHTFHGFEHLPEAFDLMVNKPRDLIKPIVII